MVSLYDVNEIFSDVAAGSVRLPRRQSGSSPQGLAVTLIADYTLRTRAWWPSAAIVVVLGEFGVTTGAARAAVSRLARRGVLEGRRQRRHTDYRLTEPAADSLRVGASSIATYATKADCWDGSWTLVGFTLPKEEKAGRSSLRAQLRWWGFAPLYDGAWVSPHPLTEEQHAQLVALNNGVTTVFRARQVRFPSGATRNPIQAWDIEAIAEQYETFSRRWEPVLPRILAGAITGPDAVSARTEVMDTYRRFPTLDPLLPDELMPPDWPRGRARELFLAVYDGLAEPAQEHVRAVIAQVADTPYSGVQAHSVAEMSLMRPSHLG